MVVTTVETGAATDCVATLGGVTKRFGDVVALDGIDLNVPSGRIVSLLGPNGAGKTTSVKLLLGLTAPSAGEVRVFGGDPRLHRNRARTGVMLQVGRVPETLKVSEYLELFSGYYEHPLPRERTVAAAGLGGLERRRFGELSGGQKQRLLFALAICGDPDLLVLDEPTVGLDVEARHALWDEIRGFAARGKTVLMTTHYLEEADALSDHIVVIDRGAVIAEGSPAEIKARTAGRIVRCATRVTADEARLLPGVLDARRDRDTLELQVTRAEPVVRELLARDADLADLEVAGADLERAFLALTRGEEVVR